MSNVTSSTQASGTGGQPTFVIANPPPYSEGLSAVSSFKMELANLLGVPAYLVGPGDVLL